MIPRNADLIRVHRHAKKATKIENNPNIKTSSGTERLAQLGDDATAESARTCECCDSSVKFNDVLCLQCLEDPEAWMQCIAEEHELVAEQLDVLMLVGNRSNVFFTGAAGAGKSRVLHAIKQYLTGLDINLATIAPTGIAALNVKGQTMHSYAGWDGNSERATMIELCTKRARMEKNWKRFEETDVIILDEVSMVESNSFTRLSRMMQAATEWADKDVR